MWGALSLRRQHFLADALSEREGERGRAARPPTLLLSQESLVYYCIEDYAYTNVRGNLSLVPLPPLLPTHTNTWTRGPPRL